MSLPDNEIDLIELWRALWNEKVLIAIITAVFAISALLYAFLAKEWYRADVLLVPADDRSSQGLDSRFGGLASLAGITVSADHSAESVAALESRSLTRQFIEERGLMQVLFAEEWNAAEGRWITENQAEWPDWRDAVKFFDENIRTVSQNPKTGLVTLTVEWTDPQIAADWANEIVKRVNARMRERALGESEANLAYLKLEMASTNIVALQQSIGRLLETELQKQMLARGNEEFAFRVIDRAEPPKFRSKPKRKLSVALGVLVGGFVSVFAVLLRRSARLPSGE